MDNRTYPLAATCATPSARDDPTDYERWRDCSDTWGLRNPTRARVAAYMIPKGSSVLDLGAGSMVLKRFLRPNCQYQPCDLYSRCPGCLVADLNAGEFPEGEYDWVAMLGVFQFLKDPSWAVDRCRKAGRSAIFSYSPTIRDIPTPAEIAWRRGEGWVNEFNAKQYQAIVTAAGWDIVQRVKIPANLILVCHAKD